MRTAFYLTIAFAASLHAQDRVQFETASVKKSSQCSYESTINPGSIALKGVPMNMIVMIAFKKEIYQVVGPSWIENDCFDIFAKLPSGASPDLMAAMLQTLLTERFKLVAHKENRPTTEYALTVDKGGPKIKQAEENSRFMGALPRNVRAVGRNGGGAVKGIMTMEDLAKVLSRRGYGTVTDETGLKGEYEIELKWVPDPSVEPKSLSALAGEPQKEASNPGPDLFTAVRESLGLKLEPRKGHFEIVVVDRMERVPTEN